MKNEQQRSGRVIETDVLVVGGGGAGFRAAIGARASGARVMLLSKGPLARCGATPMAGADFTLDGKNLNALGHNGDPNDSYEQVFNDIVTQGFYLNNQKLVDQYIRTAPQCLEELIDWGIKITFSDERAIFTTGIGIMDALLKQARSLGVDLLEDTMLLDLVTDGGRVTGALGLDIKTGEFIRFRTKAVVMATGGWHKAFRPNTGMRDLSGEGIAAAHRAGADIGNMEFITFCCNVFYDPPIWRGSIAPYVLGLLAGHKLTNALGETFLDQYDPYTVKVGCGMEWNKAFVSMASMKEIRAGKGGPHNGIFFSRGDVPWEVIQNISQLMFPNWKYKAMDLSEWARKLEADEPVEVGPAVEYFDGGIVVNERFESTLPGLYAAGECTLGAFGANRVFAAITEMLVQGADSGKNAGQYALAADDVPPNPEAWSAGEQQALALLHRSEGPRPAEVRSQVQQTAHRLLGPVRNQKELESFIDFLENVAAEQLPHLAVSTGTRTYNKEWIDALELSNMVFLLEAAARSALLRTESRGVHYREDFPHTDNDNWLKESVVRRVDDRLKIETQPATFTSITPPGGVVPYLDMLKSLMEAHSDVGGHH
jgi:succinate dehydrogenase/fumarate reductase flavoprotein subunit